jgi:nitrate reductase gamma subunit
MSEALHFSEHTLQEVALIFMGTVYIIRLIWLFRFPGGKERQAKTGLPGTTKRKGIIYSWMNIFMPWAMESFRKKLFLWFQFGVFHVGVVFSITLSVVIPYWPGLLEYPLVVTITQIAIGAACVVGVMRIIRRVGSKYLRAISSPDDYFSLILLTVWFAFAFLAVPNSTAMGEWHLMTYFILTAFFLMYVPFSKISHYLYYPFTRFWFGRSMGHRGTYPIKRGPRPKRQAEARTVAKKVTAST